MAETVKFGATAQSAPGATRTAMFVRTGDHWSIAFSGQPLSLKDINGLRYIERLLQHPAEEFHALDLIAEGQNPAAIDAEASYVSDSPGVSFRAPGDAGEMLDLRAKQEYRARLNELKEQLEDLRERGEHKRAERVESEIDFLSREIVRAVGLGGRDRRAGSAAERARLNVTRAIKTAIQKIAEHEAELAQLLETSIKTGLFSFYLPNPRVSVQWQFALQPSPSGVAAESNGPFLQLRATKFSDPSVQATSFVGREPERATLRRLLERARDGEGRVAMIGGPPGVGKTRLASELGMEAEREGFITFAGACYDRDDPTPFIAFIEIIEGALARAPDPKTRREILGDEAPDVARLMPQLSRTFPDISPAMELPPDRTRRMLLIAIARTLARIALNSPLLLVIDDLHWADEGTLSIFDHVARSLAQQPIIIIGTYRDNELTRSSRLAQVLDELTRIHLLSNVALTGLSESNVGAMVEALSGREVPPELIKVVFSSTEGNPFFVEELFHHLMERGKLLDTNGDFRRDLAIEDLDVPQSLQLIIGRRLARLTLPTQQMLGAAAVLGPSFAFDLLEDSVGIDPSQLLDQVEEAERAGLILGAMQGSEARFHFSHELVRQTALAGISAARRQRLHLAVAGSIERIYRIEIEDHAVDLAHHLWQAGRIAEAGKTIQYLAIASNQALTRSASAEAVSLLTKELYLLKNLPADIERDRTELNAQSMLGVALQNVKGYTAPEVDQAYTRARQLAEQLGDTAQLVSILRGQAYFHGVGAQYVKALELGRQMLRIGERSPEYLIEGDLTMGLALLYLGQLNSSRSHFERGIVIDASEGRPLQVVEYMGHSKATCLSYLARTLWLLGYPDQALQRSEEAVALAHSMSLPMTKAQALGMHALIYQARREIGSAQEWSRRSISYSNEHGFAYWILLSSIMNGWLLGQTGQTEAGIFQFRAGLIRYKGIGAKLGLSWLLTLLVELLSLSGRVSEGLQTLDEALEHIRTTGERYYEAEVLRLKGELLLSTNAHDAIAAAEGCFLSALEVARGLHAKSWELRAATSLARLWRDQQRSKQARELLSSVFEWFVEGFSTPDLAEANQLLDELGAV